MFSIEDIKGQRNLKNKKENNSECRKKIEYEWKWEKSAKPKNKKRCRSIKDKVKQ